MAGRGRIASAITVYLAWSLATWWLEGRIETLLRPEAMRDRVLYALIANIGIGTVGGVIWIRWMAAAGDGVAQAGFGSWRRSLAATAAAIVIGVMFLVIQGDPAWSPAVMLNGFAQVLVVSVAEIVVCWAVVGAAIEAALRARGRLCGGVAGSIAASVLFGLYHFAHSPPFDTLAMVGLLTVVGLATSTFFFLSRDIYGTVIFHNFLGTYGVLQALAASGHVDQLARPQARLVMMALLSLAVLVLAERLLLRRRRA